MIYGPNDAILRDWHDGDTGHFDIDLGWGEFILAYNPITGKPNMSVRLLTKDGKGIDAPELHTTAGDAAVPTVNSLCPQGTVVKIYSHQWDAYNRRCDCAVILPDGRDLADAMVAAGAAVYKKFS